MTRTVSSRWELLDSDNVKKANLDRVTSGEVSCDADADIARSCSLTVDDDADINWASDRLRPWLIIDGAEWPLGVFLPTSPTRVHETSLDRRVDGYDQAVILRDDRVTSRHTAASGANVVTAVRTLLESAGVTDLNLSASSETLPETRDWPPGTSKLVIVNDLLEGIGYEPVFFDGSGAAVARPYRTPDERAPRRTYTDDPAAETAVILPGLAHTLDVFDVANHWVLVVSEANRVPLVASYTNDNPASATSTIARGRTITDYQDDHWATSQTALEAKARMVAHEASQVHETVEMRTGLMHHGHRDVVGLSYSRMGIDVRFEQLRWTAPLHAGAQMAHVLRRVVSI